MNYKVLFVLTKSFDPNSGGVQRSTFKICSYLKSKGHENHVFSYQKEGHKNQDVAKLHHANNTGGFQNKLNNENLNTLIANIKPDIIINQMPYEIEIGNCLHQAKIENDFLLLSCLRNTLFTVIYNLDVYLKSIVPKPIQFFFKNDLGKKILLLLHKYKHSKDLKFILDTYDYFIMFGPPNINELKYFVNNYKLDKTHLIPNSILSTLDNTPSKEKRILWLSRLTYKQKRADLILPLWKKIMNKLPDWQLDVVGDGDAYEDLIKQINLENIPRVNLYGKQVPDKFYKRSPIYIMTSAFEGFPNTLIEAQSYACVPVLFNSYPICSWVIKKGKSGYLVPPFDISQMANCILSLTNNKKLLNEKMKSSLKNAKEFELENVGKLWTDFFDEKIKK